MGKDNISSVLQSVKCGNFEEAYKKLDKIQLDVDISMKILCICSKLCYENQSTPNSLDAEFIIKLLKLTIHPFKNTQLTELYTTNYFQALYFIVHFLIEKKCYQDVISIGEMFTMQFIKSDLLTPKQINDYKSICQLLYNIILRGVSLKPDCHLDWCRLLLKTFRNLNNTHKVFEMVYNTIISLTNANCEADSIVDYYSETLHNITRTDGNDAKLYQSIIGCFSVLQSFLLRNSNFQLAESCYQTTMDSVNLIFQGGKFDKYNGTLGGCQCLKPLNIARLQHAIVSLTKCKKTQSDATLMKICEYLSTCSFAVLQYYKNNAEELIESIPLDCQMEYFNLLEIVAEVLKCGSKIEAGIRALYVIITLARLTLSKTTMSKDYKEMILEKFEKIVCFVEIWKTRQPQDKWQPCWHDSGVAIYKSAVHLMEIADNEMALAYFDAFLKAVMRMEGVPPTITGSSIFNSSLQVTSNFYLSRGDFAKALILLAFSIIIRPSDTNTLDRWIKTKAACRDNPTLQAATLVSIFDLHRDQVDLYAPGFCVAKDRQCDILIMELTRYRDVWKSKLPMFMTLKELVAVADGRTVGEMVVYIWHDGCLDVHESLPDLLGEIVDNFEKLPKSDADMYVTQVHLYFLIYKYRVRRNALKNYQDMEKVKKVAPVVKDADKNEENVDRCDLVPYYEVLNIDNYIDLLNILHKCQDMLLGSVRKDINSIIQQDDLFKLLAIVAHETTLHYDKPMALKLWKFALEVGELLGKNEYIIQAISAILRLGKSDSELMEKADSILETLQNIDLSAHYYLCKVEALLYRDFKRAYEAFLYIEKILSKLSTMHLARFRYLEYYFLNMPCDYKVDFHGKHPQSSMYLAHKATLSFFQENLYKAVSSYDYYTFFEVNIGMVKMYHELGLPRELRMYGNEILLTAQKMILPLQTGEFLFYLAMADVSCCRLDDARVKVRGLADILSVNVRRDFPLAAIDEMDVNDLMRKFEKLWMEVPKQPLNVPLSGSPDLNVPNFQIPYFLTNHSKTCDCFRCNSLEYQQLVLKKAYLDILMAVHENNVNIKDFFRGSLKVYGLLRNRNLAEEFSETYGSILHLYSDHLFRCGALEKALSVSNELMDLLKPIKLPVIHFYQRATLQKIYILIELDKAASVNLNVNNVDEEASCNVANDGAKTPEARQSVITLDAVGPVESAQKIPRRRLKPLQLVLDDEEDEVDGKTAEAQKMPRRFTPDPKLKSSPNCENCAPPDNCNLRSGKAEKQLRNDLSPRLF